MAEVIMRKEYVVTLNEDELACVTGALSLAEAHIIDPNFKRIVVAVRVSMEAAG